MANNSGSKVNKDKEMASMLKRLKIERTTARCPICNRVVNVDALQKHIVLHR